jgi:DNA invertase Pin-like site-specific DNA recombinase
VNELCVEFVFLSESINTTTLGGMLVFHVFGVAALERDLILKRTMVGLEAAMARGRKDGRQPVMGEGRIAMVSKLMREIERRPCPRCARLLASTGRRSTARWSPMARRGFQSRGRIENRKAR